jgi:hypothetical protein
MNTIQNLPPLVFRPRLGTPPPPSPSSVAAALFRRLNDVDGDFSRVSPATKKLPFLIKKSPSTTVARPTFVV